MDGTLGQFAAISGPPPTLSARRRLRTPLSILAWSSALVAGGCLVLAWPQIVWGLLYIGLSTGFVVVIGFRLLACTLPTPVPIALGRRSRRLPHYTVVVALKDEALVVPQLIRRLTRLDYPKDRLRGYLVVEADDTATLSAIQSTPRPAWLTALVAPPGAPTTKPRALNVALALAPPGLLTVYDAEDEPHPEQLREAAARFACGCSSLACFQAPLRIRALGRTGSWLERQFALEYAALFEVILPALTRLGLPLPLGGTSNHFRVEVLKSIGGWDPWNVTEDADLGLRLARHGYRIGMLSRPTRESPPPNLRAWIPQRTRWLKGFMQTILVHLRDPVGLGWRGLTTLGLTLGASLVSSSLQGWVLTWLVASLLVAGLNATPPPLAWADMSLVAVGWLTAISTNLIGALRAKTPVQAVDLVSAPAYWSLSTLAWHQAVWRLIHQPYYWDKTPHLPDLTVTTPARRRLRFRARFPRYAPSPPHSEAPWKSTTSKTTPTSAPASSNATGRKTSRECAPPGA